MSESEGEAQHVAEGLGAYLGQKYGKSGIYPYFTADHWDFVVKWQWNNKKRKFDTPQEINLADSIMYDPTAAIMKAMNEENVNAIQDSSDDEEVPATNAIGSSDDVNNLATSDQALAAPTYEYDSHIADTALSIARSIQSASSMSAKSAESPTLSQDEKKEVLATVIDENKGRLKIVYGLGGNNTMLVGVLM